MLTKIRTFIQELNAHDITYCHWKSNFSLAEALSGRTDIDLLIHRKDANLFRTVLSQLQFRPAIATDGDTFPSVEHYYALDEESGILIHVHAYYRVITGESLAKNYHLPIEEMLLQNTREVDSVRLPVKSAELVVFTLRMMLKHTTPMELIMLARYWKEVQHEINWLLESGSTDETLGLVNCWLPPVDADLFSNCITALKSPSTLFRRMMLGRQLRSQLKPYARHSPLRAWLIGFQKFVIMFFRRLIKSHKGMVPRGGGAVIAFVGSEATGKSTLISEMREWLGEHFSVKQIHAGKPKATILTVVPNLLLPSLRALFPTARTTNVESQQIPKEPAEKSSSRYPLIFAIRSALLAYDRRALLTRAYSQAANGTIILCDRYPSSQSGTPDSPQLSHLPVSPKRNSLRNLLARIEERMYREIPAADLIIYLNAPLAITLARNASRGKREPEDYVRRRHARSSNLEFGETPVHKINTDQPFGQTVFEVKKAIWEAL